MAGRFCNFGHMDFTGKPPKINDVDMMADAGRVPMCFLVDTSASMKPYAERLNKAIVKMIEAVAKRDVVGEKVDLEVITFNTKEQISIKIEAKELYNLVDVSGKLKVEYEERLDSWYAGGTPTGYALNVAVSELRNRYIGLKRKGKAPYSPILFVFSNGLPEVQSEIKTEHERVLTEEIANIKELVSENRLVVFAVEMEHDTNHCVHSFMQSVTGLDNSCRLLKFDKIEEDDFSYILTILHRLYFSFGNHII